VKRVWILLRRSVFESSCRPAPGQHCAAPPFTVLLRTKKWAKSGGLVQRDDSRQLTPLHGMAGLPGVGLGIYHSGLEMYGREVSFGYADGGLTGVFEVPAKTAPGVMPRTTFKESVLLGYMFRSPFEGEEGGGRRGAAASTSIAPRCSLLACLTPPLVPTATRRTN